MQSFEKNQHIDDLIVGYLKNELTPGQVIELTEWIRQSKQNKNYFDESREIWILSRSITDDHKYSADSGFQRFLELTEETTPVFLFPRKVWIGIAKYAAVALIAFFVGGMLLNRSAIDPSASAERFSEIVVPRGAKANFTLNDGTQVTLNAGSKLRYASNYGFENREVVLEGEGYFKVAKDKDRPFIVKTSHLRVKALGTEFNIKAYPGEKTIETTLVEGSVQVSKLGEKAAKEEVILKPNQKITFFKTEESSAADEAGKQIADSGAGQNEISDKIHPVTNLVTEDVKVEPLISWKDSRWIIEQQDLSKLAVELERKFDIQILFESERLKRFRFTGTLLDEPVEQVLKVLSITAPVTYEINGKKVTLKEKENFDRIYRKLYDNKTNN